MRARLLGIALICLSLGSAGMAQQNVSSAPAMQQEAPPAIQIGPGDVIGVDVFDIPELSVQQVRVSQNGTVDIPVAGPIHVAGMTPEQAAVYIESQLKEKGLVLHPAVTVSLGNVASQGANIMGQVQNPGIYPTYGSRRLLDMLTIAGGVTNGAGKLVTIIHRDAPHHPVHIALAQNSAGLKTQANPIILPGDTVIVAKSGIVYVVGDVGHPGGYLIDNNERITLLQALSLAGGTQFTARLKDAKLIRSLPQGKEEISMNLKRIYEGKQADIRVDDGDIIYVPTSGLKTFIYQGINGITGLANSVGIYSYRF